MEKIEKLCFMALGLVAEVVVFLAGVVICFHLLCEIWRIIETF
jgi:hypothetical protein